MEKSNGRKPLILCGARQVGKPWIIENDFIKTFKNRLSYRNDNDKEVDFITQYKDLKLPIEVKSGESKKKWIIYSYEKIIQN